MDELCDRLASALKITDVKRLNDIKALLYADDVALIAHSRTELQKMVRYQLGGSGSRRGPVWTGQALGKVTVALWPCGLRVWKGQRLRLQVCSGAHPRWMRNLGHAEDILATTRTQAAEVTIFHGADTFLCLPLFSQQ
eukprot:g70533.t1